MRPTLILTLLMGMAVALSGCADDTSDDHSCDDGHMDEHCPSNTTTTAPPTTTGPVNTTTAPPTPNELPVLKVMITDDMGNETVTVMKGGNLTFDASASTDDGVIEAAAIVVSDANGTRPAAQLLQNGAWTPATFNFDRTGVANVSISLLDDRGGFTTGTFPVYVNEVQLPPSHNMKVTNPGQSADDCKGMAENDAANVVDAAYYKEFKFEVLPGAQWVEATLIAGSAEIAICSPRGDDGSAGAPISAAAEDTVQSNDGVNFTASLNYYVAAASRGPSQDVAVSVTVHYDPRPAAASE